MVAVGLPAGLVGIQHLTHGSIQAFHLIVAEDELLVNLALVNEIAGSSACRIPGAKGCLPVLIDALADLITVVVDVVRELWHS